MAHQSMDSTIQWLLEADPAIRWQTLRDLVGASKQTIDRERKRIELEGWGARILAEQDRSGKWEAGNSIDSGLYTPKWTSTTYSMLLLRDFGLSPTNRQAKNACTILLDRGFKPDGGINYGEHSTVSETCITGMVLSIISYFQYKDSRLHTIVEHLLTKQFPDGGWNCRGHNATHSSVNTTISALEGLRWYELNKGSKARQAGDAQKKGREFLLQHRLFRSHRTGRIIKPEFTRLTFPPRWHYDLLRALDYFQWVNAPYDERLKDAIDLLLSKKSEGGTWSVEYEYKGKTFFRLERVGKPSQWNTLRALRTLKWWNKVQ
jgi:hypothetical protein